MPNTNRPAYLVTAEITQTPQATLKPPTLPLWRCEPAVPAPTSSCDWSGAPAAPPRRLSTTKKEKGSVSVLIRQDPGIKGPTANCQGPSHQPHSQVQVQTRQVSCHQTTVEGAACKWVLSTILHTVWRENVPTVQWPSQYLRQGAGGSPAPLLAVTGQSLASNSTMTGWCVAVVGVPTKQRQHGAHEVWA